MRIRPLALTLAGSLVLASCGGSKEKEAPPPAAPAPTSAPAQEQAPDSSLLPIPGSSGEKTAELPPGHPPVGQASRDAIPAPPPGSGEGDTGVRWKTPAGWIAETPSSPMRRAQYKVPGPGGDGECAVFYFGPGQGGDPMSNAQRWAGQFKHPDGTPATDAFKTTTMKVGNMSVLLVETAGTYSGGMTMTMAPAEDKPGYRLLGAIAEGPDANWFFKLTGPEATVRAQHEAFAAMVRSLEKGA
jgi:hypothetical protein